jgi:hypothetical protein
LAYRDGFLMGDETTDYPYSIIELRGLMKQCLVLKLGHTDTYRGYKKMLKQQEAAALRDWERVKEAMKKANTNTLTILRAPPE